MPISPPCPATPVRRAAAAMLGRAWRRANKGFGLEVMALLLKEGGRQDKARVSRSEHDRAAHQGPKSPGRPQNVVSLSLRYERPLEGEPQLKEINRLIAGLPPKVRTRQYLRR